jgi:hypothetical protein
MNAETLELALMLLAFAAALAVLLVMLSRLAAKSDELRALLQENHAQLLVFVGHVAQLSVRHRRGRKPGTKNPPKLSPKSDGPQEATQTSKPLGPLLAEITQIRRREQEQREAADLQAAAGQNRQ